MARRNPSLWKELAQPRFAFRKGLSGFSGNFACSNQPDRRCRAGLSLTTSVEPRTQSRFSSVWVTSQVVRATARAILLVTTRHKGAHACFLAS